MRVGGNGEQPPRLVTLQGLLIVWKKHANHLGNPITHDPNDTNEIKVKNGIFVSQVNAMNGRLNSVWQFERPAAVDLLLFVVWGTNMGL